MSSLPLKKIPQQDVDGLETLDPLTPMHLKILNHYHLILIHTILYLL